jgi:hypothetical protein
VDERIEIRDGRVYKVTVLPDAKRRKPSARKVGGGKRYAKQAALASSPVRFCPKCKRDRAVSSFERKTADVPTDGNTCFQCRKARSLRKQQHERQQAKKQRGE